MADPTKSTEAGCVCGRCRFRCHGVALQVSYCHCADCRRATGAPVTVFVGFPAAAVETLGAGPEERVSSAAVGRLFCDACGTPLAYRDERLGGELYFHVGAMDEPGRFTPQLHAWTSEALPWIEIADDLPRYAGFSRTRDV